MAFSLGTVTLLSVLCFGLISCKIFGGGSQQLGKTTFSLGVDASKKLMFPKTNFGEIVLNDIEEYNKNMKHIVEEMENGNITTVLSSAKFLYRKGMPRFVKMMFNIKILQDKFAWHGNEVKYFFDLQNESSALYAKFVTLFQMKVSFGKHDWTPKPNHYSVKITTYKVKKRRIKEIITG